MELDRLLVLSLASGVGVTFVPGHDNDRGGFGLRQQQQLLVVGLVVARRRGQLRRRRRRERHDIRRRRRRQRQGVEPQLLLHALLDLRLDLLAEPLPKRGQLFQQGVFDLEIFSSFPEVVDVVPQVDDVLVALPATRANGSLEKMVKINSGSFMV